jgi:hypothetical protein
MSGAAVALSNGVQKNGAWQSRIVPGLLLWLLGTATAGLGAAWTHYQSSQLQAATQQHDILSLKGDIRRIDGRFDRLESKIDRLIERTK